MIYVLEFFHLREEDESPLPLTREKKRIKSIALAEFYARHTMRSAIFDGRRANGCSIKDQAGGLIRQLKCDAERS